MVAGAGRRLAQLEHPRPGAEEELEEGRRLNNNRHHSSRNATEAVDGFNLWATINAAKTAGLQNGGDE